MDIGVVKVNQKCFPLGVSVLFHAVDGIDKNLVEILVKRGADVNEKYSQHVRPLHVECGRYASKDIITILIKTGAEISPENQFGNTPFSFLSSLLIGHDQIEVCKFIFIKKFAQRYFRGVEVSRKDMGLVQANPESREKFEKCLAELTEMKNTIQFYGSCTYYFVFLKKLLNPKIVKIVNNENFFSKFSTGLSKFQHYSDDLIKVFQEVNELNDGLKIVFDRLKNIFNDYIPDVVIRILAENLTVEDLPL